jgi:hypothetical protein
MGSRNPDRVPLAHRRSRCETVGQMIEQGWDVLTTCQVCGLIMRTDLGVIAKVSGPGVSLWNRKAQCRRYLCSGFVEFHAKAPGMDGHQPLRADDRAPAREPHWKKIGPD